MAGNSGPLALILGSVLVLLVIVALRHPKGYALVFHNASWAAGLLIAGSGVITYYGITLEAWAYIVVAIALFNVGVLMSQGVTEMPESGTPNEDFVSLRAYVLIVVGFFIGLAVYLQTIASTYGLGVLLTDPTSIRTSGTVGYLQQFPLYGKILFYLGPVAVVLTLFPSYVRGLKSKVGLFPRLLVALALLLGQSAVLQRTNVFVCLTWAAGLMLMRTHRSSLVGDRFKRAANPALRLVSIAVLALIAFQGLALALGKTGNENVAVTSNVGTKLQGNSLLSFYLYWSSGIPAFGRLTESTIRDFPPPPVRGVTATGLFNPQTDGAATLSGARKVLPLPMQPWPEISPFTNVPAPTNVYTWIEPWYRDFRWPGVIVGSLSIGVLIGRVARRRFVAPERMFLASILVAFTAFAPFLNRYMSVMSIVIYAVIWLLGLVRRNRVRRDAAEAEERERILARKRAAPKRRPRPARAPIL